MKYIFLFATIFIILHADLNAQSVSINNTGAVANQSSLLDVDVSGFANKKGLLTPRMTQAQRTAMSPLPAAAQGLLVYQTDGVQGFYYNTSFSTTANWVFVHNSGAGIQWNQLIAPSGNLSLAHGANTTTFSFDGVTTGSAFSMSANSISTGNILNLSSNSNAGTGYTSLLNISRSGSNTNDGTVAIGITSGVTNTGSNSRNMGGHFSATGGTYNEAIHAETSGSNGIAVYGLNNSILGSTAQIGVQGVKAGDMATGQGTGVMGTAFGTGFDNVGGRFSATGANYNSGVTGLTDGENGTGIFGWNYSTVAGIQIGARGRKTGNTSANGYAVYGDASGTGPNNIGGYFTASGATNNYAGIFDQGIVGIGTTTPEASALLHVNVGTLTSKGLLVSGANNFSAFPNLGAGSRLMFYPGKTAFRAGFVDGTQWYDGNVGAYSSAMGYNTIANGLSSIALGSQTRASGEGAFASGKYSIAYTDFSTAMGFLTGASGAGSTALGSGSSATGLGSTAIGYNSIANIQGAVAIGSGAFSSGSGAIAIGTTTDSRGLQSLSMGSTTGAYADYSTAMGLGSYATGDVSTAIGNSTQAKGFSSFSSGVNTIAVSSSSTVMGEGTVSKGYGSTVVGLYNDSLMTTTESLPGLTTPLFIIGNGNTNATRSNALAVQKNGKLYIDPSEKNDGTLTGNALMFGQYNVTGEAIASKRTATGNQWGLDFYTGATNRMSITNSGSIGIGTSSPLQTLDINGRVNVAAGVIQRGGTAVTGTSDLGLYSRVAGNFIRLVTNAGPIRFYSDDNTGNNPNLTIESNGNVGLGTSSPSDRLTVAGNAVPTLDNSFTCGKSGQRWAAVWSVNGTIQTSDARMKENIKPIPYGLNEVMKLNPVSYNWIAKPQQGIKIGFIAQEVQSLLNELVVVGDDENKTLGINYAEFVPVLVNAIKEQQTQMELLKKENIEMKKQLNEILQVLKNK